MQTVYDWVTLGIFAGLVVLFLQRSTAESDHSKDRLAWYLLAGAGCGAANYLGNKGYDIPAVLVLAATVALIFFVLKPFNFGSNT
ncbi:MAG: XrtV sorting system accessory protein [Sphingomicrobium sp.]|nr:hypothetical protein [Sphingomonadales bacterium]